MGSLPEARRVVAVGIAAAAVGLWAVGLVLRGLDGEAAGAVPAAAAVVFAVVGALLVQQREDNRLGPVLAVGGLLLLLLDASLAYARHAILRAPGSLPNGSFAGWLSDSLILVVIGLFAGVVPPLFPTGRLPSRRWRVSLAAAGLYMGLGAVGNALREQELESLPGRPNPYAQPGLQPVARTLIALCLPLFVIMLAGSVTALVWRWRHGAAEERQQLRWFLSGLVLLLLALPAHDLISPDVGSIAVGIALVAMAAGLGVGVLRYRLYDLDLVVRRAVSYALVSAGVAGTYLAVVGVAQAGADDVGRGGQALAAVLAAAAFQPVRSVVQRRVDRVFYGDRAQPYEAVNHLSRSLEGALPPDEVLPALAQTVSQSLRLPYVCLEVRDGEQWRVAAEIGTPRGDVVPFPMAYQGRTVGRLLVSPRAKEDRLGAQDARLLTDLARHAGVAAQAVAADAALRRSRAELVAAREEERRRIRRDLHDGLGPTLAGVTLGLHAARVQVAQDPHAAEQQLDNLEHQIEEAIRDVRRLVYDLRPPALDEFGLVRAVQMHAARLEGEGLALSVDAPAEGLGRLPAAVEVAAYRIAAEALTNVTRHARAGRGRVRFRLNGGLEVLIEDDGCGIGDGLPAGVGLTAMRERAVELGGRLTVASGPGGTVVTAQLPVPS